MDVLFLGKKNDPYVKKALDLCRQTASSVISYLAEWDDPFPEDLQGWEGDYILSDCARWVVPAWLLAKAKKAAINFHPATPDYPGIGCVNFALYENAAQYGSTCHHMLPKVDTGPIIDVERFFVYPTDTVASVLDRTYQAQLILFYRVWHKILQGQELTPSSEERWGRTPLTRKQLTSLRAITPEMSEEEISRRLRATSFGAWKPFTEISGHKFEWVSS